MCRVDMKSVAASESGNAADVTMSVGLAIIDGRTNGANRPSMRPSRR